MQQDLQGERKGCSGSGEARARTELIPLKGGFSGQQGQQEPLYCRQSLAETVGRHGGPFSQLSVEGEVSPGQPRGSSKGQPDCRNQSGCQ